MADGRAQPHPLPQGPPVHAQEEQHNGTPLEEKQLALDVC